MPIFKINKTKLEPIKEVKISLEKDLQKITEKDLETVFGLDFVASEFALNGLRIDTLAFDSETKSFVIIEYKRDKSFSVIDQGYAYLALMLNNKADFILEYNEKTKNNLKRDDVDWSQSRVLFVANSFTTYQRNAINFKDLPIELWEAKKYSNETILFNHLRSSEARESIKAISKNKTIASVSKEIKKYSVDDHFKEDWEESRTLFEKLSSGILEIDEKIEEKAQKHYIAYKILADGKNKGQNFCEVVGQKQGLKIYLDVKKEKLDDYKKITQDCSKIGHWATGNVVFSLTKSEQIDYAMFLIKQVYNKFYK